MAIAWAIVVLTIAIIHLGLLYLKFKERCDEEGTYFTLADMFLVLPGAILFKGTIAFLIITFLV